MKTAIAKCPNPKRRRKNKATKKKLEKDPLAAATRFFFFYSLSLVPVMCAYRCTQRAQGAVFATCGTHNRRYVCPIPSCTSSQARLLQDTTTRKCSGNSPAYVLTTNYGGCIATALMPPLSRTQLAAVVLYHHTSCQGNRTKQCIIVCNLWQWTASPSRRQLL
jgi:hypothetical protein